MSGLGVEAFDPTAAVALMMPWAVAIAMALGRAGGLLIGLPSMTAKGIPKTVQAIAVVALSVGLVGAHPQPVSPPSPVTFCVSLVGEFLLGYGMGFLVQLSLAATRIAGELIGIEMGLSFAAVADPISGGQSTAVSTVLGHFGIQLFIALGLDRWAIVVLSRSIEHRPLGTGSLPVELIEMLTGLMDALVETAFTLALPLTGGLLCLKLSMAMLARVAPKLQIFTLAFALSIAVGLVLLNMALPSYASVVGQHLSRWAQMLSAFATSA